jgi:hypothetical protein
MQHHLYFLCNKCIDMEQDSINQRLNSVVDTFERGVKAAFARKAGISPQGAQELLAGRKGDPSFKVLVKILESYPTIDANWLVLGRGPMLQEAVPSEAVSTPPAEVRVLSDEQWQQAIPLLVDKLASDPDWQNRMASIHADMRASAEAKIAAEHRIYSVADDYPAGKKSRLSTRLGVTEEQARQLVTSGQIRAKRMDAPTADVYLIPEQAVREYLGEE